MGSVDFSYNEIGSEGKQYKIVRMSPVQGYQCQYSDFIV